MNTAVRDTGEIAAGAISLQWAPGAQAALQRSVAQGPGLGLANLDMRLHNLLVYGPGQFFKPHQDTEKHPGMVASLVLAWSIRQHGPRLLGPACTLATAMRTLPGTGPICRPWCSR